MVTNVTTDDEAKDVDGVLRYPDQLYLIELIHFGS